MIWIIWYHTCAKAPFSVLEHLRILGYGGVDICLFGCVIFCSALLKLLAGRVEKILFPGSGAMR